MAVPCDCCPTTITRCVIRNAPAFFATFASQAGNRSPGPGASAFTFTNFAGSGVNVVVTVTGDTTSISPGPQEPGSLVIPASSQRTVQVAVTFSLPVYIRKFGITDLDFGGNLEFAYNWVPPISGPYGQKDQFLVNQPVASPATNGFNNVAIRGNAGNDTGGALFNGNFTTTLKFSIFHVAAAGSFLTELGFDLVDPHNEIILVKCPGNPPNWYDHDGNLVNPASFSDCPPELYTTPAPGPVPPDPA